MEQNDDIMDRIRAFLKGRMSPAEEAAFKKQMKADPVLEDKVAFAKIMMAGLDEVVVQERNKKNWLTWAVIVFVVLLLASLYYFVISKNNNEKEEEKAAPQRATQSLSLSENTVVGQGGGNSNTASDRASSVIWNSKGEAILSGQYQGPAIFGQIELPARGEKDIFLAAYAMEGGYLWAEGFGSKDGLSSSNDLAIDRADNIIMTGQLFNNTVFGKRQFKTEGKSNAGNCDFYVAKLSPTGELVWLDHGGGNMIPNLQTGDNIGRAVAVDPSGNIIAVGDYIGAPSIGKSQLPVGGPNEDTYLAKYSSEGEVLWAKAITGKYMVSAFDVTADLDGNIFVIGYFGHHNLGGNAVFDTLTLETFGGRDIFIAKYAPDGKLLWANHAGSPEIGTNGYDYGMDVAADNQGGCLITGWFQKEARFGNTTLKSSGMRDVFIVKYAADGTLHWATTEGGEDQDQGSTVVIDKDLNNYCAGFFRKKANFGNQEAASLGESDIFITKYNKKGELLWLRQMGGDGNEWNSEGATEMSINNLGQIVLTGYFSGKMKIGTKTLDSQGREDIFLVFFDKNGNLLESKQLVL